MSKWQIFLAIGLVIVVSQTNAETVANIGAPNSIAAPSKCIGLSEEIKSMRDAERTLLRQMASNNTSFAMTLDQYAEEFSELSKTSRSLNVAHLSSIKRSAQAYRGHEQRELKLVGRFEEASDELFARIESCIK